MTVSPSQDSYWDAEAIGVPQLETEPQPESADATEFMNPPPNACPTCGEEVVKEPGQKRRRKYHEECKPSARGRTAATGTRAVRVVAKDREAAEQVELALDRMRTAIAKGVALLALVEPYDAFVLHVNSKELIENMRPILMRFPWLREQAGNATAIGSIVGLAITLCTTALPILAHHGFIPAKKVTPFLIQIPVIMQRMQQRLADAEQGHEDMGEELLARLAEEQNKRRHAEMKRQGGENVGASTTR